MPIDLSDTIQGKSEQLNAVDLIGGKITATITGVKRREGDKKQPTCLEISGGYMPFLPCLNMRRLLIRAWGADGSAYIGRQLTLYCDPDVVYANERVGGIRISALSDIPAGFELRLIESKRLPKIYKVEALGKASAKPKEQTKTEDAPKPNAEDIESEVHALSETMKTVTDEAGMNLCRAEFSRLTARLTAEQRAALVALAEAAKGRVAVPVAPADVAAAGKGQLL